MKEKFMKLCQENRLVGASALVVKNNEIVEVLEYGLRSVENNELMSIDTVFRIASISKVVVASGIMRLVEEKILDIDEDVNKYLGFNLRNPNHPDIKITLKMLMTQTSSITDGFDDDDCELGYNGVNGKYHYVTLEQLLIPGEKFYIPETFDKEVPGSKFIYSNFNCGILACIIERVTGRYFVEFIREEVLLPLGLDASFDVKDIMSRNFASLYIPENNKVELIRDYNLFMKKRYEKYPLGNNFRGPAGGLFISPRDLKVFMEMLMNEGKPIFQKETIDLMLLTHWQGNENSKEYYKAKGLQVAIINHFNNRTLKGHFGDAYGVRSFMLFNEEKQIGMIYMTNGGFYKRQDLGMDTLQEELLKTFLDKYWE